jgi:RimJ/RimL family protein N-acetyltransferase
MQMTDWIFANTTILRLFAGVFETNPASMRVLEKAGYKLEAIHRKAIIKNDQVLDEHLFVKLAGE